MNDWRQFEKEIMEMLAKEMEKLEMPVRLYEPDEKVPVHILVTVLEGLGVKKQEVKLELCFLPMEESKREEVNFNFIQFFATIRDNVEIEREEAVLKLINSLNSTLPVGSMGLGENGKVLYLKYCCPYIQGMPVEFVMTMTDSVMGMLIHALDTYVDMLSEAVEGKAKEDSKLN